MKLRIRDIVWMTYELLFFLLCSIGSFAVMYSMTLGENNDWIDQHFLFLMAGMFVFSFPMSMHAGAIGERAKKMIDAVFFDDASHTQMLW